jgi:hypothetical protein
MCLYCLGITSYGLGVLSEVVSDLSKQKVAESGSEIGNWGFPLIRREPFRSRHLKYFNLDTCKLHHVVALVYI